MGGNSNQWFEATVAVNIKFIFRSRKRSFNCRLRSSSCFWKVREYERSHARVYRECERSHTRVFRECERYNSRVHRDYEARRTRAESKGLGEESAGPARRTRAESSLGTRLSLRGRSSESLVPRLSREHGARRR